MKRSILLTLAFLLSIFELKAGHDWNAPSSTDYSSHAVVYVAFQNSDGERVGSVGGNSQLGAFIDGQCRAVSTEQIQNITGTNDNVYIFTLRIGVGESDANKSVTFALRCGETEYSFAETITVSGGDETVGGIPSNPFLITYTPVSEISLPQQINVNMGETVNLRDQFTVTPKNATLPDAISWDYSNSQDYFSIKNDILTPKKPNTSGLYLAGSFSTGSTVPGFHSSIVIHQPITGLALSKNYSDGKIQVNVDDPYTLTDLLAEAVVVTPSNATESITWKPSDAAAIVEVQTGVWNPAKTGTYEMVGQAANGASVTLTVKIVRPVESMSLNLRSLNVMLGDEITQYLPHTLVFSPTDATDPEEGLSFAVGSQNIEILKQNNDGTITANQTGESTILISHSDIGDQISLIVNVVNVPNNTDFEITHNPLVVELSDSELKVTNILQQLLNNVAATTSDWKQLFNLENFFLTASSSVVSVDQKQQTVYANEYGTTTLTWTYYQYAAGFDEGGKLNSHKEYTYSFGYGLTVTEGLENFDAQGFNFGLEDESAVIKVTTVPENYILDDAYVKWTIPAASSSNQSPVVTITERVKGKNEWLVKANFISPYAQLTLNYKTLSDTCNLSIGQRVSLDEGWHWLSLYAGNTSAENFDKEMANAQEVRSQYSLTYNDPVYGFFGGLSQLTTSEAYKIQVKEGSMLNMLVLDQSVYSYTSEREKTFHVGWTWMNNPYCFSHNLNEVFAKQTVSEGSRIVSKDAFAIFTEGSWTGTLSTLDAGAGYLFYNGGTDETVITFPAECNLKQLSTTSRNSVSAYPGTVMQSPWKYDSRRFSDNMSIIAEGAGLLDAECYTVGAFVGDECRGEGTYIKGKFFITVHGVKGENVTFKLYDNAAGAYVDLSEHITFTDMCGTFKSPLVLHAKEVTGISGAALAELAGAAGTEVYNLSGQRITDGNFAPGIYVVKQRTAAGTVTRKIIKK